VTDVFRAEARDRLAGLAAGDLIVTLAAPPRVPFAGHLARVRVEP
jgi:hypothetical protein